MQARSVRFFSTTGGSSHFQDLESELLPTDFAPSIPPLYVSSPSMADQVSFFGAPANWRSDWHPSSGRHLFAVLSGEWEISTSDGDTRRFKMGDVILVEDTSGIGHTSRVVSKEDSLALLIRLT